MRTFEMAVERISIKELEPGMRLMEILQCTKNNCPKHAQDRMIIPGQTEGKELSEYDILRIWQNCECLYTKNFQTFDTKDELLEFIRTKGQSKIATFTVILIQHNMRELRTETGDTLQKIADLFDERRGMQVKIAVSREYSFTIQRPTEKKREFKTFLKTMKNQVKEIYNQVENGIISSSDPLPPELVANSFETIKASRSIFDKLANDSMMRELQNDSRDSYYDGIHNHIYNVALTSAKILNSMKFGKKAHLEQVFAACFFLDIGIPLAMRTKQPIEKHPQLGANFYSLYLQKVQKVNLQKAEQINASGEATIAVDEKLQMNMKMGKNIIDYHHERLNGTGYPYKFKAHQRTQEFDRLVAVVDEFYKLTSDFDYHKNPPQKKRPLSRYDAIRVLEGLAKKDVFDPRMVKVLKENVSPFPLYSFVTLNGIEKGVVIGLNTSAMDRPKVFSLDERKEINLATPEFSGYSIEPDASYTPRYKKITVDVNVMIKKKKNSIQIFLEDGYVCPWCQSELGDDLPAMISKEFSLDECLVERKDICVCPEGHFCVVSLAPPESCNMLTCKQGDNCTSDWNVYVEGF